MSRKHLAGSVRAASLALLLVFRGAYAGLPLLVVPVAVGVVVGGAVIGVALLARKLMGDEQSPGPGTLGSDPYAQASGTVTASPVPNNPASGGGKPDRRKDAPMGPRLAMLQTPRPPGDQGAQGTAATRIEVRLGHNVDLRTLRGTVRVEGPGLVTLQSLRLVGSGSVKLLPASAGDIPQVQQCQPQKMLSAQSPCSFVLGLASARPVIGGDEEVQVVGTTSQATQVQAAARAYVYDASFVYGGRHGFLYKGAGFVLQNAAMILLGEDEMRMIKVPQLDSRKLMQFYVSKDGRQLFELKYVARYRPDQQVDLWGDPGRAQVFSAPQAYSYAATTHGLCQIPARAGLQQVPLDLLRIRCFDPGAQTASQYTVLPPPTASEPADASTSDLRLLWGIDGNAMSHTQPRLFYYSNRWRRVRLGSLIDFSALQVRDIATTISADGVEHALLVGRFGLPDQRWAYGAMLDLPARGDLTSVHPLDSLSFPSMDVYAPGIVGALVAGSRFDDAFVLAGLPGYDQTYTLNHVLLREPDFKPIGKSSATLPANSIQSLAGPGCLQGATHGDGRSWLVDIVHRTTQWDSLILIRWSRRQKRIVDGDPSTPLKIWAGASSGICMTPFTPMLSNIAYATVPES